MKFGLAVCVFLGSIAPALSLSYLDSLSTQSPSNSLPGVDFNTNPAPEGKDFSYLNEPTAASSFSSASNSGRIKGFSTSGPSDDAAIRSEYNVWLSKFGKQANEARYPAFKSNFLALEKYGQDTGNYLDLNEFADCTEEEYKRSMSGGQPQDASPEPVAPSASTPQAAPGAAPRKFGSSRELQMTPFSVPWGGTQLPDKVSGKAYKTTVVVPADPNLARNKADPLAGDISDARKYLTTAVVPADPSLPENKRSPYSDEAMEGKQYRTSVVMPVDPNLARKKNNPLSDEALDGKQFVRHSAPVDPALRSTYHDEKFPASPFFGKDGI